MAKKSTLNLASTWKSRNYMSEFHATWNISMLHMLCECPGGYVLFSTQDACFMTTCVCLCRTRNTVLWKKTMV